MRASASLNTCRSTIAALTIAGAIVGALLIAGPLEARSSTLPVGNLVQNPGGEADVGASDYNATVTPQGWATTGTFTAVQYGTPDSPTTAFAGQIGGGSNYLAGGRNAPLSTATQVIDVSGATAEIDAGGVQAKLSAYLGGYASQKDAGMVDAVFLTATDSQLGSLRVGPVGPTDRQSKTTLVMRSATAAVPKGTTKIKVVLTSTRADGTYNDGYLDNISLELGTAPPPGKPTLVVMCSGKTLVATLRPGAGTKITSVAFLLNGKAIALDIKAPFTQRFTPSGHPTHLTVGARVRASGKVTLVSKTVRPC